MNVRKSLKVERLKVRKLEGWKVGRLESWKVRHAGSLAQEINADCHLNYCGKELA
jgi:hypothetical protein